MTMPTADMFRQIGSKGLNRWGGLVNEEFLPELRGARGRRVLREMAEQDPVIAGVRFAIEMLVRRVEWTVNPADESELAAEIATHVHECLHDMEDTLPDIIAEIVSFVVYGWSLLEVTYKQRWGRQDGPELDDQGNVVTGSDQRPATSKHDDGRIGWRNWALRAQDTLFEWIFTDEGDLVGMKQMAPPDYRLRIIPISKCMLFRTTVHKGNPEGRPAIRGAYKPWYFKRHIEVVEGIGIERDLAGLPVAWVPPSLLATDGNPEDLAIRAELERIIRNIKRDEQEGLLYPLAYDQQGHKLYDLTLLSTGGQRQFDTDKIVARYDQRIAMALLADFILLGHEAVGSKALSQDKTEIFGLVLDTWLDMIAAQITERPIRDLVLMNGWPVELAPTLEHGAVDRPDLEKLAAYVKAMADAGMLTHSPELEAHLRSVADLPAPPPPPPPELPSDPAAVLDPAADPSIDPTIDPSEGGPQMETSIEEVV